VPPIDRTLVFLLLGLGAGAVYASLGLGLVLVHRVSGVVHVAHGAVGAYVTYVFVELRTVGDLVLPVGRIALGDSVGLAPAFTMSLLVAAAIGLLAYLLVFRPLRGAPALAGLVASVGLMATLQALIVLRFGGSDRPVGAILPSEPIALFGSDVPRDRLLLAAIVVGAAAVLWAVYRFTRFGLASRAASDDRTGVALLGWSPDRLAAVNWVVASVLAGLGAILAAPVTGLHPVTTSLLVVPALAAALVGRLVSLAATAAAALALGMVQSLLLLAQDNYPWMPRSGVREALPLVVILLALALGAGARLARDPSGAGGRLPRAGRPRRVGAAAVAGSAAGAAGLLTLHGQDRVALVTSLIGALVCLSIVVLTGWSGQISLAQMAFAGVAGFSLSRLGTDVGVPFPVAPLLAAALAALTGLAVGLPALRARGVSLAVVTLAGAVVVEEVVFKSPTLTGGFSGSRVDSPLDPSGVPFGLLVLAVLVLTATGLARLRLGRAGHRLLAVRANERAAAAVGVDVTAARLQAFALSAFLAGLAGALLGYQQGALSYGSFGVFVSLAYLAVAYLGGIAGIAGALVAGLLVPNGLVFTLLDIGRWQLLVSGIGLMAVTVLAPGGMTGWRGR
jgi:branched-chain amino acid transport system permease protein